MPVNQATRESTAESIAEKAPSSTGVEWDRVAQGYDRTNTPTQMWLGEIGLQRAQLRPGMRFLDVAAGSGALSIPAARMGAQVLATDQSPLMLQLLAARAEQERLSIETRVMDGHALEVNDNAVDIAGSQFGVMLFPDMRKGIAELVRVVAPGGRVLMTVYGDPHQIDFLDYFVRAVGTVRPGFTGPPSDPPPLPFQLQDPLKLRAELMGAGLHEVTVETIVEKTPFQSGKQLWDWIRWSNPLVESILRDLAISDEEARSIECALDMLIRERANGTDAAVLSNPINIGVGTKR